MAKFKLSFKGTPINVYHFESGSVHIGRDESNSIRIDSLAVAPAHAAVVLGPQGAVIRQLNDDFPLVINGQPTSNRKLCNGDEILIGKHSITFTSQETIVETVEAEDTLLDKLNHDLETARHQSEASLQVVNGRHIGRMIPLKKALTRLGKPGKGVAVIAKRKEGYFISALEGGNLIKINRAPVNDGSLQLNDGDIVEIDKTSMQFYENG